MMKKIISMMGLIAAICLMTFMASCDSQREKDSMEYAVTCTIGNGQHSDSATLLVLEQDYNKLRVLNSERAAGNTFTFKGQTSGSKVALIRLGNDTIHPFMFILEPGHIDITIKPDAWNITGSTQNIEYQNFVNQRNKIMNRRVAIWQDYLKASDGGKLNRESERRMVEQDSLLNDTLQRITVDRINRGDAVGRIIRERFATQLDQDHMRQLK